jgi:hypothetical protein
MFLLKPIAKNLYRNRVNERFRSMPHARDRMSDFRRTNPYLIQPCGWPLRALASRPSMSLLSIRRYSSVMDLMLRRLGRFRQIFLAKVYMGETGWVLQERRV